MLVTRRRTRTSVPLGRFHGGGLVDGPRLAPGALVEQQVTPPVTLRISTRTEPCRQIGSAVELRVRDAGDSPDGVAMPRLPPADRARTAAPSPRSHLDALVDFHTGRPVRVRCAMSLMFLDLSSSNNPPGLLNNAWTVYRPRVAPFGPGHFLGDRSSLEYDGRPRSRSSSYRGYIKT